jgi:pyrimidine operon attenuation protein/uracil phosphoribosyltransferase
MPKKNIILDNQQIEHKIKRIAYQIYESNVDETDLILAGISSSGFLFAKRLNVVLQKISDLNIQLCEVKIDKKNPLKGVKTSLKPLEYTNKSIVLIDDVLNSGTTLIYGVKHFLEVPLKQFKTAVLVDRSHKKFPVKADFKGISLSTSLNEMVQVHFSKGKDKVELL